MSYGEGDADEFIGTGLKYNGNGEPTAGTITSYSAYDNHSKIFSVENMSVAATSIMKVAKTALTTDDQNLLANILKGNDNFTGGNASDFVRLYIGNDVASGRGGSDTIYGGAGNDKITGGLGRDHLRGEAGSDTFIFKTLKDSGISATTRDTIYDFTGPDTIDLSAIDAQAGTGNQAFSFINQKAFTGHAGELRYEKKASDTFIFADVNGDKKADFSIHLDDAVTLNKGDFIL